MESKLLEEKVINVSPHHPHVRVRGEEKVKEKYYPAVGWCSGWAVLSCSLFTPVVIRAWRLAADGDWLGYMLEHRRTLRRRGIMF